MVEAYKDNGKVLEIGIIGGTDNYIDVKVDGTEDYKKKDTIEGFVDILLSDKPMPQGCIKSNGQNRISASQLRVRIAE